MNMKHRLMIACLCSLPVGFSIFSARLAGAATFQSQQSTNQSEDVRTLAPGAPVEREMSGGQRHLYQLALEANQCLKIVAEQRGADVSLTLNGPDGKPFDTVENNRGGKGVEWLLWQAQTAGNYQLEVKSRGNNAAAGVYRIEVETFAAQGAALPAFQNYLEARQLELQRKPELANQVSRLQEESLAAWQKLNHPQVEGLMLLLIAANNVERDGRKSLAYYQRALQIFQSLGMKAEEARALNAAGLMSMLFGNYRDSRRYFEQALSLAEYFQPKVVTMIVGNLGSSYFNIGESQKGMEYHLRSLADSRAANDQMSVLVALEKLSQQCHLMGESAKSLGYINEGLLLARELKSSGSRPTQRRLSVSEGILLGVLGNLHREAGDYEKAVEILQQSIALHREAGNAVNTANRTLDLGNLYLSQGKAQLALELFSQALTSLQKASEISGEAHALAMIGRAHSDLGDYRQALDALNRALAIIRANELRSEEWPTLINLAEVAERMGDGRKAVALLDEALSVSRKMAAPDGVAAALTRLARLARRGGDFNQARQFFEASLRVSEERRFRFGLRRLKDSFGAGEQNLYEEFIGLLMQLHEADPQAGNDRIAFETSERARARGLLDLLAESRAEIRQGADPALLEKHRALQQRLNAKDIAWRQSLDNRNAADQTEALAKEIDSLAGDLQMVELQIRAGSPRYAALVQPQPLSATEVQQMLDENTVILEFALGETQSWVWAVTRDSLQSFKLPPRAEIEAAARNAYELLTARLPKKGLTEDERLKLVAETDAELQTATAALSRTLLGPISAQLQQEWKGRRLAVVASGALEYLPFAALPLPESGRAGERESGRAGDKETRRQGGEVNPQSAIRNPQSAIPTPLIVDHEIVNLPSASALALIRKECAGRRMATKTLAALADPIFEANDPRLAATRKKASSNGFVASVRSAESAPSPSPLAPELACSARSFHRDGFSRLIFSNEEAEFITSFAPKGSTLKATGFEANRQLAASKELGQYRIVHFATHGLINSEHPELSGLVLSLLDENGKPQDGFLRTHEIFNLQLPADLVVLSACQTALGKEIKGEGLVGLTRGFMYAGAERVVASLWQVDDQATAELMKRFYHGMLKDNLRPAAALRAAQIEMSKISRWSAPYYWAGFVIQGEWK